MVNILYHLTLFHNMSKAYFVLAAGFVWNTPWQRSNPQKASCIGWWCPSHSSKLSIYYHFYLCRKAKVIFWRQRLCFYPYLLVCLSVSHITGKRVNGFHESCRIGQTWCKEQSGTFWGCSVNTLAYMISFSIFFLGNPCLLATLQKNV